jgi:hypothetical protein
MKRQVALFFAFILMALGLALALHSLKKINLARASLNWPSVPARIISSEVKATTRTGEKKRVYTTYRADISFVYTVNGKEFNSHEPSIDQPEKTFATDAKALVAKYPAGKSATARYNPADVFEAVLEPGPAASSYVAFIVGLVLAVLGMAWFGYRLLSAPRIINVQILW